MSLLNSLFNRGLLGAKCKTALKLAISRINLLRNKRQVQLKQMRKEIAQFLQTGQEAIARIRVEHVIREENILAAKEHNLEWDPSVTEEELCKKHEDLLDGSRQVPLKAETTSLLCASAVSHDGPTTVLVPPEIKVQELNPPEVLDRPPKSQTSNALKSSCIPSKNEDIEEISVQSESRTQAESCDVLQIARAAIASAERATAAARAAANLANLSLSSKPADSVPPQSGLKDHVR